MRLALVVLGVQRLVLDTALVQKPRELLGVLDGHGADQARLALRVARGDVVGHGVELAVDGAVHQIVLVDADDRPIGGNGHDRQLVDLAELRVLGHGGTGHAGELVVEAEVVLQRDGGQRLVLLAHEHVLFGLERLVQALGVAASLHDAAGELVDDLHLAVHDDVVHVAVEEELGLQRLLQVVRQLARRVGVDVLDAEHDLDLLKAALRGVDGALGLVHVEVDALFEAGHDPGELLVGVGGLGAGAGDDERGAGLIDQDGVHLVDDGEVVPALHPRAAARDHVVAQVVEAELGVSAVGDVGLVGGLLRRRRHAVLNEAGLHAEEAVDLAHPLAVAPGQIVVDGHDVHVVPRDGVQVAGQGGHERLALAGLHLGDLSLVQGHAADELHVEVAKPDGAHGSLAYGGEGLGEQIVQALAGGVALAELLRLSGQLLIGKRLELRFQRVDLIDFGLVALQLLALAHREQFGEKSHRLRLLSVVGERSWGRRSPPLQQLPSPSLGGRTGRLGANLLHSTTERRWRAQFHRVCKAARPPSAPGCARLRPVAPPAPGCARLRPLAPPAPGCARLRPLAPGCAVQCRPAPSYTVPHHPAPSRTILHRPAPSHPVPFAAQPRRTPAPSHPGPFALLHRHTPALRVIAEFTITIRHYRPLQPYSSASRPR